jgi:hypothetical protein
MTTDRIPRVGLSLLLAGAGAGTGLGCRSATPATGIVAEVTTDLRVPGEIGEVQISATAADGSSLYEQSFPLAGGAGVQTYTLPVRVGLHPQGDATAPFRIEAVGLLDTKRVVSRSAVLSFEKGRVVLLPLPLLAVCAGVSCTQAATTCTENGTCQPEGVDPSKLPTYHPGSDGGVPSEGGPAGADAGTDAAADGAADAGRDVAPGGGDARDTAPAADGPRDAPAVTPDAGRDLGAADAPPDAPGTLNVGLVGYWSFDQQGMSFPDNSGNGNTATLFPAQGSGWTSSGPFGGALDATASQTIVGTAFTSSLASITTAVTLAGWVLAPAAGTIHTMISHVIDSGQLELGFAENGSLRFAIASRVVQTANAANGDGTQWSHIAATYDGSVVVLYLDGTQILTSTIGSFPVMGTSYAFNFAVGYDAFNGIYIEDFNGLIDEITVYSRALTAAEVGALARGIFPTKH